MSAGADMNAMYRLQRHIYDATRKFYLLGRDQLIRELEVPRGGTVLEIGCGTARNLIAIAREYPDARCFGIDVSSAMLETARGSITKAGLGERICVGLADATCMDRASLFGYPQFNRVVISYALSMIPDWGGVLQSAARMTAVDGELHLVDFGNQAGLPLWFRTLLFAWLRQFSVSPRLDLATVAEGIAKGNGRNLRVTALYRGYASLCRLGARQQLGA